MVTDEGLVLKKIILLITIEKEKKTENKEQDYLMTDRMIINVPYMGKATQQLGKDMEKIARKIKPTAQVTMVKRPLPPRKQLFRNKDKIPKHLQ